MRLITTGTVIAALGIAALPAIADTVTKPGASPTENQILALQSEAAPTVFEMVSRKYREWAQANEIAPSTK